jgi:hypothetical protein
MPFDQESYSKPKRARKKAKKKAAPKRKKAKKKVAKKAPRKAKKARKKARKAPERADRWRKGKLYQARDNTFHSEDHELLTPETIDLGEARRFVAEHHYLAGLPDSIRFVYGLWHKPSGQLVGVAAFGSPAYPHVLPSSFPGVKHLTQVGSELVRLVLLDEVPKNGESWFVGAAFKDLRQRDQQAVISFSDPAAGHVGGVYKALGAGYTGQSKKDRGWTYLDTGTPVTPNDRSKLKAACPVHRAAYKKKEARLLKKHAAQLRGSKKAAAAAKKAIKNALRGNCGSGRSISGWEGAIARFERHGAPPYRGGCLWAWREAVLPTIAVKDDVAPPGKHRYLWEWPDVKGLSGKTRRKTMREAAEALRKRSIQREGGEIAYPCGICQETTHKTRDCPRFRVRASTPEWLRNPVSSRARPPMYSLYPWAPIVRNPVRRNADADLRALERNASSGDPHAVDRYHAALRRAGLPVLADQLAAADESARRNEEHGYHRLLFPNVRKWRDLFSDELPWRTDYEVDVPPELHGTDYRTVRDWIRRNAEELSLPHGEIGVAPDQTYASVTVETPRPDHWITPWEVEDYDSRTGRTVRCTVPIGPFCSIRGGGSLYVKAQPQVIEAMQANMIAGGCSDSLGFQVTLRGAEEPRTALVAATNSTIIGGRWLAIIPALEVPRF